MPTYFIINELDDQYTWKDFEICDLSYDYALDTLNIPEECIESINVSTKLQRVEITIIEDRDFLNEDWYYSLLQYSA
ncbi:MAG: hypothetical protein COA39_009145 [Sulfurimonas sp.]|nr:hypothetical protein [Sulfurimonas sp.]